MPFALVERIITRLIGHLGVVIHGDKVMRPRVPPPPWTTSFRTRAFPAVISVVMTDNLTLYRILLKLGFEPLGRHH